MLENLNPEQLEMATTIDGPVFTLAAAGSGKTHTMISRLAYMIQSGINPNSILLLTFTNKAANEMKERAKKMVGDEADKITACTYHSFCVQMLRKYSGYAGLRHDFTVISQSDAESAISLIKAEFGLNKTKGFPPSKTIAGWISATINTDATFSSLMENTKYEHYISEVAKIKKRYLEYKQEREYLDYDDMLVLFLKAISENEELARKISSTYQYIMCDETQDENNIQTNIIDVLRREIKNICIIGDDGQCLPEGTLVKSESGYIKIEDLYKNYVNRKILCASGNDYSMYGKVDEVLRRKYKGDLICIKTKTGKSVSATPEHIIFGDTTIKNYINNYKTEGDNKVLRRITYTLFGEDRPHSNGKYSSQLCFNTIEEDIAKIGEDVLGTAPCLKRNVYGTRYYNGRKVGLDHDLLMDCGTEMITRDPRLYFHKRAKLIANRKPFDFMPFRNLREGMKICIEKDGKIIEDEIISVTRKKYDGYVYDINIKEFRNYLANDIVVHNCLYSWRGANVHNFLSFPTRYPDAKKITLFRNYRSSQEILDLANRVMEKHMTEGIKKKVVGQFHGEMPKVIDVSDQEEEARYILNKIKLLKSQGITDIAVLERTSTQSLHLEGLLTQSGISYTKYCGIKFLERSDVVDVLAYLRVIVNPIDELAWYRVLKNYEGIGNTYAEKLSKLAFEKKYELLLDNPYKTHKFTPALQALYHLILTWREMDMPIKDVIEHYIQVKKEKTIDTNELKALDEEKEELLVLADFNYPTLAEFLDSFILDQNIEEESDGVVISTIHSAKGLEWDAVFLLDAVDGFCPMVDFVGNANEEELRCFYVAITRPRKYLYLMNPRFITRFGKTEAAPLSRYLEGCDDSFIKEGYYESQRFA